MASRRTSTLLLCAITGASLAATAVPSNAAPGFTTSPLRTSASTPVSYTHLTLPTTPYV